MLLVSTILYSIDSALNLVIVNGLTSYPLYFTYVTGWFGTFISAIHLMPIMVLACDLCPVEVEATFYSFVLAIINVGYLVSY
jgi:hypothetical protein